ncbi:MAG: DUF1573 domain-containing protein [Bacteroidales bacterium]|nr:DUF1573 domain-containing protein [Bacteroidales bacterium]
MRGLRNIFLAGLLSVLPLTAQAQLKLFAKDSVLLDFKKRHIVAAPMSESDGPVTFLYEFMNTGLRKVNIKRVVSTCSCIHAYCSETVVAPGEKAVISVRFTPQGHPGKSEKKIFVYTKDGNEPAAVLRLSIDVDNNMDISGTYPISMGDIKLKRSVVRFRKGEPAAATLKFINVSGRSLKFDCDRNMLPGCLNFYAEPVRPLKEAVMKIAYDPSKPGSRDEMTIFLQGVGVSPGKASIKVIIE